MNFKDTVFKPLQIALILLIGMAIGLLLAPASFKPSFFGNSDLPVTEQVLELIKANYTDTVSLSRLNQAGLEGMLNLLDPHSKYIPPYHAKVTDEEMSGQFGGIGVEYVMLQDTPFIMRIIPETPAEKAGLKKGDRILSVNDSALCARKRSYDYIIGQMRGEPETSIKVVYLRSGKKDTVMIKRKMILSSSIPVYYMVNANTGYVKLELFSESTYSDFTKAMKALKGKGMKNLILDLRDNGGGLLDEATEILDEFLDEQKLMVYTKGRIYGKKEFKCRVAGVFEEGELVVLTNENTASASELIAGALQDYDRAVIIGRRTYGKGSVQRQYKLLDGGYLRLTIARYYIPSGRCIQKNYGFKHDAYYNEIYNRSDTGSFNTDTTTYYTAKGRKVYGGGGILPDLLIASGSTLQQDFSSDAAWHNRINTVVLPYVQMEERNILGAYNNPESFSKSYRVPEQLFNEIIRADTSVSILSKSQVEKKVKSIIGKYIYGNEAYYQLLNQDDPFIQESLKQFSVIEK